MALAIAGTPVSGRQGSKPKKAPDSTPVAPQKGKAPAPKKADAKEDYVDEDDDDDDDDDEEEEDEDAEEEDDEERVARPYRPRQSEMHYSDRRRRSK
jgi:hypothetical protein